MKVACQLCQDGMIVNTMLILSSWKNQIIVQVTFSENRN